MLPLLLAVAVLILASALTSMTEAAIFSVPLARVEVALREHRRGSRRLRRIKAHMHRPVAALVILNNAVNIGGSIFVGFLAESEFRDSWLAAFTALLTFAIIVFAEIIPKTLGERFSSQIALAAAPPLLLVAAILAPLIWVIERISRPFAGRGSSPFPSEEEISALVHLGREGGEISSHEWEMIRRVFRLNDVTARDIMTHRLKLSTLPGDRRLGDLRPEDIDMSHSRILVTENGDIDKVTGVVYQRDLLLALAQGEPDERTIEDIKNSILFVYESTPAHRLLHQFQRTRQHLFVVVDEYGGTQGVVSLEDVLEELVGEILDETDPEQEVGAGTSPSSAVEGATGSPPRPLAERDLERNTGAGDRRSDAPRADRVGETAAEPARSASEPRAEHPDSPGTSDRRTSGPNRSSRSRVEDGRGREAAASPVGRP